MQSQVFVALRCFANFDRDGSFIRSKSNIALDSVGVDYLEKKC